MTPARRAEQQATIVVDLAFGDSGKGTVTDLLAREGARWVVRFNGGAQAGHNVVTPDCRHHTFSQLGSGTFVPSVRTHLSRHMVVHPTALLVEAEHLARRGVLDALDRLTISREALVITPYHQAANRLRERARGDSPLGTCGVGFGETVGDFLAHPDLAIRAGDLLERTVLANKLARVRELKREELRGLLDREDASEAALFDDRDAGERWVDATEPFRQLGCVVEDGFLRHIVRSGEPMVLEGAQGVLLDEWRGFHPHTTWSTCTFANADSLLAESGFDGRALRLGVVRSYFTRHGSGPFPTEDAALRRALPEGHNADDGWQGSFRVGWLDALLLRYAAACCGGVDAVAVTHLDRLRADRTWRIAHGYRFPDQADRGSFEVSDDSRIAIAIKVGPAHDLVHQAALTRSLREAQPIYRQLKDREEVLEAIAATVGAKIVLESDGPTAQSKRWRTESHEPDEEELELAPQRQSPVAGLHASPSQSAELAHGLAELHC